VDAGGVWLDTADSYAARCVGQGSGDGPFGSHGGPGLPGRAAGLAGKAAGFARQLTEGRYNFRRYAWLDVGGEFNRS
jgi:hypothetical protein